MDNNFQTSFIPKKPLAEDRTPVTHHTSLFSFIATLVFFGALASAAGMYFYKASLVKNISSMADQLDKARDSFELPLISDMQKLDRRLGDANTLLNNHIAVSPIFKALEVNTLKTVQFTRLTYATPVDPTAPVTVRMSGRARDYASIALQSDQLATNKNIHNSIFSNLSLDDKTGMVSFDLVFTVDADLVRFVDHLDDITPANAIVPSSGDQQPSTTAPNAVITPGPTGAPQAVPQ